MDLKLKTLALIAASLVLSMPATAASMRDAKGKACHPTERTIFKMDGVTPLACEPAGGPPYSFTVYVGDNPIWEGRLGANEPEVSIEIPTLEEADRLKSPRLIFKRDLQRDPMGYAVFFGEASLSGFESYKAAGSVIQLPLIQERGLTVNMPPDQSKIQVKVGRIKGAVADRHNYRIVIRSGDVEK